LAADGQYEVKTSQTALRGLQSNPAVMTGSPMGINPGNNFSVDLTNNKFVVSVDDVKGTVVLEPKTLTPSTALSRLYKTASTTWLVHLIKRA
jgi:hypothetical protein